MRKQSTTIEQQIVLLRSRGIIITDETKTKEILLDIGYYRLCFYAFPFELTYPNLHHRTHNYEPNIQFEDIVALYYFDFDLRKILVPYLTRIEVAFRTSLTYYISNKYPTKPHWFIDASIVNPQYAKNFVNEVYYDLKETCPTLQRHHKSNPHDKVAPAWKTIEMMMFGKVVYLYKALNRIDDQRLISKQFNINQVSTFLNYIEVTRIVRNACAHGLVLFDFHSPKGISKGPAGTFKNEERHNLCGMLKVISYMLAQVSPNRARDMQDEIEKAMIVLKEKSPIAYNKMRKITGL